MGQEILIGVSSIARCVCWPAASDLRLTHLAATAIVGEFVPGTHRGGCALLPQSQIPPPVKHAAIGPIAVHLPEKVETNEQLKAEFPNWDLELIASKTGIEQRHIAAPDECASDLGVAAAQKLFEQYDVDPTSIDFLLLCTQTPDYPLPTTACLMQDRLKLPTSVGAIDFNLGC
jgi:hypothetical protein